MSLQLPKIIRCVLPLAVKKCLQQFIQGEANPSIEAKSIFIGLLLRSFATKNEQHNSLSTNDEFPEKRTR